MYKQCMGLIVLTNKCVDHSPGREMLVARNSVQINSLQVTEVWSRIYSLGNYPTHRLTRLHGKWWCLFAVLSCLLFFFSPKIHRTIRCTGFDRRRSMEDGPDIQLEETADTQRPIGRLRAAIEECHWQQHHQEYHRSIVSDRFHVPNIRRIRRVSRHIAKSSLLVTVKRYSVFLYISLLVSVEVLINIRSNNKMLEAILKCQPVSKLG